MKSQSVMHQAEHVGAYERFLMQLTWELLLETHHRLVQDLCPNVFTANYVVLSQSWRQNTLAPHDPQTMSPLLVWLSSGLNYNLSN